MAIDCVSVVDSDPISPGICEDVLDFAQTLQEQAVINWPGKSFHAYVTPFIIGIGLVGNVISLRVFTYTRLRKLSASLYLIALSVADSCVLLTYVLCDWLLHGLPYWQGGHGIDLIHKTGLCQGFLFVSYVFRFVTVYLIILFSVERYVAVCRPLQRQAICSKKFARKTIMAVHMVAIAISFYKPVLSGIYPLNHHEKFTGSEYLNSTAGNATTTTGICTWNPDYEKFHFVMELLYGLIITAVPFVIVTVLNVLLLKQLITKYFRNQSVSYTFKMSKMKIEFTVMVVAVSSCFVCLNIPYFVVWIIQNLQPVDRDTDYVNIQRNSEMLSVTRTIFSINYSINFFVYCLTGSYYRKMITTMLHCHAKCQIQKHRAARNNSNADIMLNNYNITEL